MNIENDTNTEIDSAEEKSTTSSTRPYIAIVTMMDLIAMEEFRQPYAYYEIVEAASQDEAVARAEEFALYLASAESAWDDEIMDGLPFAEAQAALRANGFYLGNLFVEPLANVALITPAPRD